MDLNNVILQPVITEKSMTDAGKSKYTFLVAKTANKDIIRKAIEEKFSVNVVGISTMTSKGGTVRTGTRRVEKKRSPVKKAIVQIKKDQKISLFDVKEK